MTSLAEPICLYCRHYHDDLTCDAFPAGIPDDVLCMVVDHRQPVEGDGGIQFQPDPTRPLPKDLEAAS